MKGFPDDTSALDATYNCVWHNVWAQEGVNWPTAQDYTQRNLDEFSSGELPLFPCFLDPYESFNIKDTYAFVRLSRHAHNTRSDKSASSIAELREARWLLEELMTQLQDRQRQDDENDQLNRCTYHEQTKLWLRRVKSHLKLADALLQ
jgi:hypothetical protein